MKKKILFIIMDGLGDHPIKKLDNKTPLEYANTPNFDFFAKHGITGLVHPLGRGIITGSDISHLAIFGYDTKKNYPGRGPFEAAGAGIHLQANDIAFRTNIACVDREKEIILDRRAGRITNTKEFEKIITDRTIEGVKVFYKSGTEHRGSLVLRGSGLSSQVTSNEVQHSNELNEIKAKTKDGEKTATVLNTLLKEIVPEFEKLNYIVKDNQIANYLLIRGAGKVPKLTQFKNKYNLDADCIAGADVYKGVGKLLGMNVIHLPGATGTINTDVKGKITMALDRLEQSDFVFLHFKGTDNAGHDGEYIEKVNFIEKIDKHLNPVTELTDTLIVVTSDHSTPCLLKDHSGDPVPIMFYSNPGHYVLDKVNHFNEKEVQNGGLGHLRGKDIMPLVLSKSDRSLKLGS